MKNYYIGLPTWAFPAWNNRYFTASPSTLSSYASVFNTVEGNTTFYHIPDSATVGKWLTGVRDTDFKFCFKLPRTVTHQQQPDFQDLHLFFKQIAPLKDALGPFLLQFPSTIGPSQIVFIKRVLDRLPDNHRYTLEVRHPAFFKQPQVLQDIIEHYRLGLAVMDTRPIFNGDRKHPEVLTALHDKPDVPVWNQVYNQLLFVRLLLHPDLVSNAVYIEQWAGRIARALQHDCSCHMMIHCPNNLHCPPLALQFHEQLRKHLTQLSPLPPWPVPQQHSLL